MNKKQVKMLEQMVAAKATVTAAANGNTVRALETVRACERFRLIDGTTWYVAETEALRCGKGYVRVGVRASDLERAQGRAPRDVNEHGSALVEVDGR